MAFLKILHQGREQTVFLGDDPVMVGRGQDVDVLLKDFKVSRHHCVIEPAGPDRWRARDLGSGNGTKLNGHPFEAQILKPDDVLSVGDARIVFAGQAASLEPEEEEPQAEAPPREAGASSRRVARPTSKSSPLPFLLTAGVLLLVVGGIVLFNSSRGSQSGESQAYQAVLDARSPAERKQRAAQYLKRFRDGPHAAAVREAAADATGESEKKSRPYDPAAEVDGLDPVAAVARLKALLATAPEAHRAAIQAELKKRQDSQEYRREVHFTAVEKESDAFAASGQYARARELWFFLRDDNDWQPIPAQYQQRVVDALDRVENAAAAERAKLLSQAATLQGKSDLPGAISLLETALPRFRGTAVESSLRERIATLHRASRKARGAPTPEGPAPELPPDFQAQLKKGFAALKDRDFAGATARLRALEKELHGLVLKKVQARVKEAEAADALFIRTRKAVADGTLKGRFATHWRVEGGDQNSVQITGRGGARTVSWKDVPAPLFLALLEKESQSPGDALGLAVAAHSCGSLKDFLKALAAAYQNAEARPDLDRFVAARVRHETVPKGGYVVMGGKLLSQAEYQREKQAAEIAALQKELQASFHRIEKDKAFLALAHLDEKAKQLDEARKYALALIFDEKKYFYPYRGTGREGEYHKVQQEVDRRVAAVREIWQDKSEYPIRTSRGLDHEIEKFEKTEKELERRGLDSAKEVYRVALLRSYLGKRLDVRNYYRNPEELERLLYSVEILKDNANFKGDVTDPEREQVQVTNEYRLMFGRYALRLVQPLVHSARKHSAEMSRLGYFSHFSPTPGLRTPWDRMRKEGYTCGVSENIAVGTSSPTTAHNMWCHSSGHHRNILMLQWTEMGAGLSGKYWTQNFGNPPRHWNGNATVTALFKAEREMESEEEYPGDDGEGGEPQPASTAGGEEGH